MMASHTRIPDSPRCFLAAADELHFGRAAQRLQMLPSALGRHIKLLEEDLGTRLFARTTRAVELTENGAALVRDARPLLVQVEAIEAGFRNKRRAKPTQRFRIGAIDSAAAGTPSFASPRHSRQASNDHNTAPRRQDDPSLTEAFVRRARSGFRAPAGATQQAPRIPAVAA